MNTSRDSKLRRRAYFMGQVRAFFEMRGVMEVDCPALSPYAPIDVHIDVMKVEVAPLQWGYLHTSPEYGMKKLLAEGCGDIYQMSHVFRYAEQGPHHTPEFMMIEWYRVGWKFEAMIAETLELVRLFVDQPTTILTYQECFLKYLHLDPFECDVERLSAVAKTHQLDLPQNAAHWDKDTWLQLLLATLIEPRLSHNELFVLTHFPPSQAALSRIKEGRALRFEIYVHGIEVANGYEELTCAREQQERLEQAQAQRVAQGKERLPLDVDFIEALRSGLPECCGVAVGFDRLLNYSVATQSKSPFHSVVTE